MQESNILDTKYIVREIMASYFCMISNVQFSPIFGWVSFSKHPKMIQNEKNTSPTPSGGTSPSPSGWTGYFFPKYQKVLKNEKK